MTINYIIENPSRRTRKPVFDRDWCKPVNLMLFGLDESKRNVEVCSPEWREQVGRLIDRMQKEIISLTEQGKGAKGKNSDKIRDTRDRLRDLYSIESQCCV